MELLRRRHGTDGLTELELWVVSVGASLACDVKPCQSCRVAGVVERLRIDPSEGVIDATVSDGTGSITARWPASFRLDRMAITPGRLVILDGSADVGSDGHRILNEPSLRTVTIGPATHR